MATFDAFRADLRGKTQRNFPGKAGACNDWVAVNRWIPALLFCLVGCGEAVAKAKNGAGDEAALPAVARPVQTGALLGTGPAPAATTSSASLPSDSVGTPHLAAVELSYKLSRFFEILQKMEKKEGTDDVRIVQFGDSHTAADLETAAIRRGLQARFGDGGRGFVAIGAPFKGYIQDGVKPGLMSHFESERGKHQHGKFVGDGFYGLAGASIASSKRGARASSDVTARASRIELSYLERPRGGTFDVFVDGNRMATVKTNAKDVASGWKEVNVPEGPHSIEVRARGDGDVRVFGAALDRPQLGLTFDALGINGARITTLKEWDENHFTDQLRHRAPDLVILAYGTNEAGDDSSLETYERHIVDVLGRVARAVPSAACLLLGPPDRAVDTGTGWVTIARLRDVIAVQRRVAAAAGCAFFDQQAAIGGDGTAARWAEEDPPRVQRDRVHYTRESYAYLGQLFAKELLLAYDAWRKDKPALTAAAP